MCAVNQEIDMRRRRVNFNVFERVKVFKRAVRCALCGKMFFTTSPLRKYCDNCVEKMRK